MLNYQNEFDHKRTSKTSLLYGLRKVEVLIDRVMSPSFL